MSPDMKRLCRAAADECASVAFQHDGSPSIFPEDWEKVVRAVLATLREPSDSLEAACRGIVANAGDYNVDIDHKADEMRAAMIDHILGEPATA